MKNLFTLPVIAGAIFGIIAPILVYFGNPPNMGVCAGCFSRDIAGSLGLHNAAVVQYMRPEILAIVLGSLFSAFLFKGFSPRGGSSPLARFFLGVCAMIGILVFLGCPWRALLRLSAGDLSAIAGILGMIAGVLLGVFFIKRGFSLGASCKVSTITGLLFPIFMLVCLELLVFSLYSSTPLLRFSSSGVGAAHAPVLLSLLFGLLIGVLFQKSRFCSVAAISELVLFKSSYMLCGVLSLLVFAFITNLTLGFFHLGFSNQPIAHNDFVWNFLGMLLAGLSLTLSGGCPGRQLVLSGEGDSDAGVFVLGAFCGGAIAHNFSLAASPNGIGANAPVAVIGALIFVCLLGIFAKGKK